MPRSLTTLLLAVVAATPSTTVLTAQTPATTPIRFEVAPTGNEARYRVREQLAGLDFPNDAVGVTPAVTGAILLDANGAVVTPGSVITIDLRPLKSDKDRRDGFVQRRLLETETYPNATLTVTAIRGLPSPLPTAGPFSATIEGQLTVKGNTRPTTWTVQGVASPTKYTGTARTSFTFEQFGLEKPRLAFILTIEDTIALEYDFTLLRK